MRSDVGKKHKKSNNQKLKELQVKAERRRLDGVNPTRAQNITLMESVGVLDEITRNMLPEKIE